MDKKKLISLASMYDELHECYTDFERIDISGKKKHLENCLKYAKDFFDDDQTAFENFKDILEEIYREARKGNVDEAKNKVERQLQQLIELISHVTGYNFGPGKIAVAKADTQDLERTLVSMTELDFSVGQLCEEMFGDGDLGDENVMRRMLLVLKFVMAGGLEQNKSAKELLQEKASSNSHAGDEIVVAHQVAHKVLESSDYKENRGQSLPRMVSLTNGLISSGKRGLLNNAEFDTRGSIATLVWYLVTVGLCFRELNPKWCDELISELDADMSSRV
jgi:hypothetical protein